MSVISHACKFNKKCQFKKIIFYHYCLNFIFFHLVASCIHLLMFELPHEDYYSVVRQTIVQFSSSVLLVIH